MTFREFAHRRALIAATLGIPVADVTIDEILAYDAGEMEPMEACDWHRLPASVLSSGPYVVPAVSAIGPYTIWPMPGGRFADDEQWPSPLPSLLTEGSGGND
jgi:hypothetical protein